MILIESQITGLTTTKLLMCTLDSLSACIDLLFISQRNLPLESGVCSFLHTNSHHQIIFA